MDTGIAYLAQNKLFVKSGADAARIIESQFGLEVRMRMMQTHHHDSWKTKGRGAKFMSGALLWGSDDVDAVALRINITGIGRGRQPHEILYALNTDDVSGIFVVDTKKNEERRLFHTNNLFVQDLCAHASQDLIACSVAFENGTCHLAVMNAEGSHLAYVTEGDSVEQSPHWIPSQPRQLICQSAGIGRNQAGYFMALGPFSLQQLDLDRRVMTTLVEDPHYDFLSPQMAADDTMYWIRRPYTIPGQRSLGHYALEILLSPVRLLYAIFQWLNFFTMRYTGKPLTTASGPKRQGADIKQMMIWGNLIDAEKAMASGWRKGEDAPSLVPKSWELMRKKPDGNGEVLVSGVLCYDLMPDGTLLYSNGSAVYRLSSDGQSTRVCADKQIMQLACLGTERHLGTNE